MFSEEYSRLLLVELYVQPCKFQFLLQDELIHELKQTLNAIKLEEKGVYVQASTLGSLEALLEFLRTSEVPVSNQTRLQSVVDGGGPLLPCGQVTCGHPVSSTQESTSGPSIRKTL